MVWNETKLAQELEGARAEQVAMRAVCAIFRRWTWMTYGLLDGIFRRRVGGSYRRADATFVDRVELCKELAWKYRKQLIEIASTAIAA